MAGATAVTVRSCLTELTGRYLPGMVARRNGRILNVRRIVRGIQEPR